MGITERLLRRFVRRYEEVRDPAVREGYGLLAGMLGIVLNLLLSVGKFFTGLVTGSIAITADAFNNLSDAGSSVVTMVGFRLAGLRADDRHPFGHGRIEYLAGLLVSVLILLVGLEVGRSSVLQILHPEAVAFSWTSAAILVVAVGVKLWMCGFYRELARRIDSSAMRAAGTDALSDAAATGVVLLGGLLGQTTDFPVDGWVGLLVAAFILRAGWGAAKDTISPLLGQPPDPELVREIEDLVLAHPLVTGLHDLVIHDYGPGRSMMSFHAELPMETSLMEAHDMIDHIERELKERFGILTTVHMDPVAADDQRTADLRDQVTALVQEVDPCLTIHDFRVKEGPRDVKLMFDVVNHNRCPLGDEELEQEIVRRVRALNGDYEAVVQVDRAFTEE